MFGIGFPELILILIIGLVIFGPGKLPEIGRAVGKGLQEFKKASSDFSNSLNETPSNGSITPTPPNPANPNQPAVPPVFMQEKCAAAPAAFPSSPGNGERMGHYLDRIEAYLLDRLFLALRKGRSRDASFPGILPDISGRKPFLARQKPLP